MKNESNLDLDREAWLTELAGFILDDKIAPLMQGAKYPANYRISIGYPPRTRGDSKAIAVCIQSGASADSTSEIFVSPKLGDSLAIAEALTHELVHYSDDCASGHRHHFARVARRIGLLGPLTATYASPELKRYFESIIKILGDIPHAAINLEKAKPKQSTRMIKVLCPKCAFNYRASASQLARVHIWDCPACDDATMAVVK